MVQVDLLDKPALKSVFSSHPEVIFESSKLFAELNDRESQVECVIHFAALKAVGESFTMPLAYYGNNITGACNLLEVLCSCHCYNIITNVVCIESIVRLKYNLL